MQRITSGLFLNPSIHHNIAEYSIIKYLLYSVRLFMCLDKSAHHQDAILCVEKNKQTHTNKQALCHFNIIGNSQNTKGYAQQQLSSWKGSDMKAEGKNNPWFFRLGKEQLVNLFVLCFLVQGNT